MKEQKEKTMKVELTFKYWLSKDGQLSGESILTAEQTITGEIEVIQSVLENLLRSDGKINQIELNPGYSKMFEGLYFDSLQTVENLYERYLNYPKEKKEKEFEKDWEDDFQKIKKYIEGESVNSWSENNEWVQKLINKYDDRISKELFKQINEEFERRKRITEERKAEIKQQEDEAKAEKIRIEEENDLWIKEHGSDRLKRMVERGYEYRLTYEMERGNQELPDFIYDREGEKIIFKKRANPSQTALLEEAKYIKKYGKENVSIVYGIERDYDEDMGWYNLDEKERECIWVKPKWSRQGFVLFMF